MSFVPTHVCPYRPTSVSIGWPILVLWWWTSSHSTGDDEKWPSWNQDDGVGDKSNRQQTHSALWHDNRHSATPARLVEHANEPPLCLSSSLANSASPSGLNFCRKFGEYGQRERTQSISLCVWPARPMRRVHFRPPTKKKTAGKAPPMQ